MVLKLKLQLSSWISPWFSLAVNPWNPAVFSPQVDQRCGDESPWPLRRVVGGHVKGEVWGTSGVCSSLIFYENLRFSASMFWCLNSFGYGSIPIDTFLGGWTSINPSYFDVNRRGTIGFDTLPFQWQKNCSFPRPKKGCEIRIPGSKNTFRAGRESRCADSGGPTGGWWAMWDSAETNQYNGM